MEKRNGQELFGYVVVIDASGVEVSFVTDSLHKDNSRKHTDYDSSDEIGAGKALCLLRLFGCDAAEVDLLSATSVEGARLIEVTDA